MPFPGSLQLVQCNSQDHLRAIIFGEWRRGSGATAAVRNMADSSLGEDATAINSINRWFAWFAKRATDFNDKPRLGRPKHWKTPPLTLPRRIRRLPKGVLRLSCASEILWYSGALTVSYKMQSRSELQTSMMRYSAFHLCLQSCCS